MDGIPLSVLEKMPAMKPPPGYTTDFANPGIAGSNASETIITVSVLLGVTTVILLLRLYTRILVLGAPGWDDLFAHGFGVHQWNVRESTLLELTDYLNAILYMYKPFMLLAKLSLCIMFLRIFGEQKGMRWAIYFAIAYNVVLQVAAFFLSIFLCIPGRPSFWQCSHTISKLNVATAGCNIFADFYLLFLPIVGISRLQMSNGRKMGVALVFLVGMLACIASILGLTYRIKQNGSPDVTWNFSPEIILVTFELEATIIVGSVVLMPALFKSKNPYSFGSMWSNRSRLLKNISVSRWTSSKGTAQSSSHGEKTDVDGSVTNMQRSQDSITSKPSPILHDYPPSIGTCRSHDHDAYATDSV